MNENNRVYVCGRKNVLSSTHSSFSPSRQARVKMSLKEGPTIFVPKNINYITIIITLE